VAIKLVTCLGFGIDAYHGVNHVQVLENIAALDRDGGYLGALSIPGASRKRRSTATPSPPHTPQPQPGRASSTARSPPPPAAHSETSSSPDAPATAPCSSTR
jgi:hypothetical protein